MRSEKIDIIVFVGITTFLILMLSIILVLLIYLYQQKRFIHNQSIKEIELRHERTLADAQLELQENTFRHISQEIHDNIGLTLSLAKLRLNTLSLDNRTLILEQVHSSVDLITESINRLKDISRSLNADVINSYGLLTAIENEIKRIKDVSSINIAMQINGETRYMDSKKELIIFRIIQESLNNIIKHSQATSAFLFLNFSKQSLDIEIVDNGKGFNTMFLDRFASQGSAGLRNMEFRCKMIQGQMNVHSNLKGTRLKFLIPL